VTGTFCLLFFFVSVMCHSVILSWKESLEAWKGKGRCHVEDVTNSIV